MGDRPRKLSPSILFLGVSKWSSVWCGEGSVPLRSVRWVDDGFCCGLMRARLSLVEPALKQSGVCPSVSWGHSPSWPVGDLSISISAWWRESVESSCWGGGCTISVGVSVGAWLVGILSRELGVAANLSWGCNPSISVGVLSAAATA